MHLLYTPQTQYLLPSYRVHVLCAYTVSQLNSRLWPSWHSGVGGRGMAVDFLLEQPDTR